MVELFTASGTQQGEIFGVAASGRTAALPGINVFRVRDGRITERWGRLDELSLMRQRAATPQVSSLLLSAYGLTSAQSRVVALVIRGHSTRQIVQELHISAHTVQEHLTAAFDKFGVRSRRELVAAILSGGR